MIIFFSLRVLALFTWIFLFEIALQLEHIEFNLAYIIKSQITNKFVTIL